MLAVEGRGASTKRLLICWLLMCMRISVEETPIETPLMLNTEGLGRVMICYWASDKIFFAWT